MKDRKQPGSETTQSDASEPRQSSTAGNKAEQRNQKENQSAQLSAANVEESPRMDKGDSEGGAGESLRQGGSSRGSAESLRRAEPDTQYGTRSSMKAGQPSGAASPDAASGGAPASAPPRADQPDAANPGSSEDSSGAERDTMSGPRPSGRS